MKLHQFILSTAVSLAAMLGSGCSNEDQLGLEGSNGCKTPLCVSVSNTLISKSGGVIFESYLPESSTVGLFLQGSDGGTYDNLSIANIPYVSTGTSSSQTWAPQSASNQILLSATEGKAYAYYPYNAENTSFSSIKLDASRQDDVMYSSVVSGLSDTNAEAPFQMQHAMAVIKVKVKRGTYTGTGAVTGCSVSGVPIGLTGTLDGTTGNLTGVTVGKVTADKTYTINDTGTDHDILFVPTTTSGVVTVGLAMDGKEYTTTTSTSELFLPNQCYTLNLTVDDSGATLSGIEVGEWTMNGEGNSIIKAGGYKIKFEGDYSKIGYHFSNESSGDLIIACTPLVNGIVNEVGITGTCLSQQDKQKEHLQITLTSIQSDITITFNGLMTSPYNIADILDVNGVYAITNDGKLTPYLEASPNATKSNYKGVAFVVRGRAYQVVTPDIARYIDRWCSKPGVYGKYKLVGTAVPTVDGSNKTGYLPRPSGVYYNDVKLSTNIESWTDGALNDFDGKAKTALMPKGAGDFLGQAVSYWNDHPNSGDNPTNYSDWYLPALGQLAYIYVNKTEINALLEKTGCSALGSNTSEDPFYCSSSEQNNKCAWGIDFKSGRVYGATKGELSSGNCFIRDL